MENEQLIIKTLFEIKEKMGEMSSTLDATHDQAKSTNGRVSKLEALENIRKGKNIVYGAIGGLGTTLLIGFVKKILNI